MSLSTAGYTTDDVQHVFILCFFYILSKYKNMFYVFYSKIYVFITMVVTIIIVSSSSRQGRCSEKQQ